MTIYNKPVDGTLNSMKDIFSLSEKDVRYLALRAVTPDPASLIFGDYTKWASNLLFYPINLTEEPRSTGTLTLNGISTDIPVNNLEWDKGYLNGFDIGEIYYSSRRESQYKFAEYEPYTSAQLYLPYYGYANLKMADILDKYIEVKLDIDLSTGQALYTVMVSPYKIPRIPRCKYWLYNSGDYAGYIRVIGTYTFQLGSPVPFGSSGMTDAIRNTLSTVVKGGATLAGYYAGGIVGGVTTSTVISKVEKINADTNRLRTVSRSTETKTEESNPNKRGVETAFQTAGLALNNVMLAPVSDKPNNSLLGLTSERELVLIIRSAKLVEDDYSKLYGLPYGRVETLKNLSGYTEISRIHVEGISEATSIELSMIERLLSDGVILPEN